MEAGGHEMSEFRVRFKGRDWSVKNEIGTKLDSKTKTIGCESALRGGRLPETHDGVVEAVGSRWRFGLRR